MPSKEKEPLRRILDLTKHEYGLTGRLRITDLSQQGYYGGVIKLTEGTSTFALKQYSQDSSGLLRFTVKVFDHLREAGFTNFSQFIPTVDDNYFFNDGLNNYFVLYRWIEGNPLSDKDKPEDIGEKLRSIAMVTALFHRATSNFPRDEDTIIDDKISGMWGTELIERYEVVESIINTESDNVLAQMGLDKKIRLLLSSSNPIINGLRDVEGLDQLEQLLTWGIVHHDLWIGHTIFDADNNNYLIDFDRLRYGRVIDDLERIVAESIRFGNDYGRITLETYLAKNPISEREIKLLPFMIQYGVVRRTFWLINKFIVDGVKTQQGPLDLSDEIDTAIGTMNTDLDKMLFSHV